MTAKKPQFVQTKFSALVKRHAQPEHTADPNAVDPVALLIASFLMYDAPSHMAEAAMQKIRSATVDFNEFRVSLVEEMVQMIGVRYPRAEERCKALRRVLYDIFRHHHKVSLSHLEGHPKQHIRAYLDNLDGMQARRTNRCSKLGELMDHWLDAIHVPLANVGMAMALQLAPWAVVGVVVSGTMIYQAQVLHYHVKRVFIHPPTSGTDARSGPKNLPRKTLATPQRWKKRMPRGSRSGWRRIGQIPKIAWP